jgi:hypothetical protein
VPLPFRPKALLVFSTACFRIPETRSILPRRCSRLLRVPRPSSSAILPFLVCAVFLIVRATVVAGLAVVR